MSDYEANFLQGPFPVDLVEIGLSYQTSVLCVAKDASKVFVAFKLAQEIQRNCSPGHFTLLITENTSDSFTKEFIEAISLQTSLKYCIATDQSELEACNIDIKISSSNHIFDFFNSGSVSWNKINLVIIDNCHLATIADHSLRSAVNLIKSQDFAKQPIIVGVTANLPVTSSSHLKSVIDGMESVFGCGCHVSCDLVALNRYGEISQENVIHYSSTLSNEQVSNEINSHLLRMIEFIEQYNQNEDKISELVVSRIKSWYDTSSNMLKRFGSYAALYHIKIIQREVNKMHKKSSLSDVSVLNYCKETLDFIQKNYNDTSPDAVTQLVQEILSSLWIVKNTKRSTYNSSNVTTDTFYRNSPHMEYIKKCEENCKRSPVTVILCLSDSEAAALNYTLNQVSKTNPEFSCIKSAYVSSANIRQSEAGDDEGEVQSQAIVQLMNKGEVNVLVISCDVENEIFVASCKQLIRFGLPLDYLSYVKVKRIARDANAEVVFVEDDDSWKDNDMNLHQVFKDMESVLSNLCEPCKFAVRDKTSWDKLGNISEAKCYNTELAIAAINRYCSSFPNDGFGSPHPCCAVQVVENSEKVKLVSTLHLPSHSPIYWPFQASIDLPKEHATPTRIAEVHSKSLVAVATLAYKTLQETGELERQGPRLSFKSFTFKKADIPCSWEVIDGGLGNDGSTKRRRAYDKKFPSVLVNSLPTANVPVYLYHISLSTSNVSGDEGLAASYNTSNMFGLLSRNSLPKIPKFTIYSKATELTVTLTKCSHPITLTSEQLDLVKRFHSFVHRDIMSINSDSENEWFQFDPEKQTYGVYIVPVITTKEKANSDAGNINKNSGAADRNETAKCDDKKIELLANNELQDCSCCLNIQQLNLQDDTGNAENNVQNDDSENNSSRHNRGHAECDFSRNIEFHDNQRVSSDVAGNIDNNSLQYTSCSLPSTIDTNRHIACDFSSCSLPSTIDTNRHIPCDFSSCSLPSAIDTNRHIPCDFSSNVEFDSNLQIAFNFLSNIEQDLGDLLHPEDPSPQGVADFERYRGRVITAVYMKKPTRYIVTDISYDMTPLSPFSDPEVALTFFDYFKQRYGLEVRGDQPLLQVKPLPKVTNGLVSKYRDSKGRERPLPDKESKRRKKSRILLIPELCSIHPVPLSIWQDAVLLPTILYRLEAMLLAEELRQTIALQAGVGDVTWPDGAVLPLLSLGESVEEYESGGKLRYGYSCANSESCFDDRKGAGDGFVCNSDHVGDIEEGGDGVFGGEDDANGVGDDNATHSGTVVHDVAISYDGKESTESNQVDSSDNDDKRTVVTSSQEQENNTCHHHHRHHHHHHHIGCSKCSGSEDNALKRLESSNQPAPTPANTTDVCIQTSVSNQPSSTLLLKALTCVSALDVFNHERIELYGDSFIKFAVSLNTFCKFPHLNVGHLSFYRGLAISNRQLLYLGHSTDIPSYIINQKFHPLINWCPYGFTRILSNMPQECRLKLSSDSNEVDSSDNEDDLELNVGQSDVKSTREPTMDIDAYRHVVLSDKTVADTTEAIIGAYLVTGGGKSALDVMKWLGFDVTDYFNAACVSSFMKKAGYAKSTNQNDQKCMPSFMEQAGYAKPTNQNDQKCMPSFMEQAGYAKPTNQNDQKCMPSFMGSAGCPENVHQSSFIIQTRDDDPIKTDRRNATHSTDTDKGVLMEQELDNEEDDDGKDLKDNNNPCSSFNTSTHLNTHHTNISNSTASVFHGDAEAFEDPVTSKAPMTIASKIHSEKDLRQLEEEFKDLELSLGYVFKNKILLHQALIHVSYPRSRSHVTSSYEHLEFLGDALLDFLVTRHLYFTHSSMTPGGLTDLRAAIVNSYSFAFLSVQHGFHKHLRSMSPAVFRVGNKFTSVLRDSVEKKKVAQPDQLCASVFVPPDDSEENSEGVEVPKILADIFESVVAAVFLDSGMDVEVTWRVVYKMLKPTLDHYADHPPYSPVRQLKEMLPNDVCFSACELAITGRYTCIAQVTGYGKFKGTGRSPKIARSTAAQKALAHIEDRKQKN